MWKFQTKWNEKKNEVIAYTSRVLRSEREQPDMISHAAYKEGRRWGRVKVPVGTHGPMGTHLLKKNFPTVIEKTNASLLITYYVSKKTLNMDTYHILTAITTSSLFKTLKIKENKKLIFSWLPYESAKKFFIFKA